MRLLLIRHAIAEDREVFKEHGGADDGERPLRRKGRARMKKGAHGLSGYADEVQQFATSPYARAASTARIVVEHAGFPEPVEVEALLPDRHPSELLAWLLQLQTEAAEPADTVAVRPIVAAVGHEPHLSSVIAWCVTGGEEPLGELKKGGACLLRFDGKVERGQGCIEWVLTAGQLRRLGRREHKR